MHQSLSNILKALPLSKDSIERCIDDMSINIKGKFSIQMMKPVTDNKALQWHVFTLLIILS